MSIPHKNSRVVVVDGKSFRYHVKIDNINDHPDQRKLTLTIQENVEFPGKAHQTSERYFGAITPSYVCETIRQAIKYGWNPSSK
jgi:hypothetical protein